MFGLLLTMFIVYYCGERSLKHDLEIYDFTLEQ